MQGDATVINFMSKYHNFIVNPIVTAGSNTIERVMTYKLLGIYVSNDLKWNHHVEVIVQKGNRRLYSLRVLKKCGAAPPASLAKVYTTIVPPVIEYAAPVWQNIPDFLSVLIRLRAFRKGQHAHHFSFNELPSIKCP